MALDHKDIIEECRDTRRKAEERDEHNRLAFVEDIEFSILEKQWDPLIEAERDLEGRPCLTISTLQSMVRQVTNEICDNLPKVGTEAVDRDADIDTSEVYSDILDSIQMNSRSREAFSCSGFHAVAGGMGFHRVGYDYCHEDSFDKEIFVDGITNPLSVFGDPRSTRIDSSDWMRAHVIEVMEKEEFQNQFEGADESGWSEGTEVTNYSEIIGSDDISVCEYWKREEVPKKIYKLSNGSVADEELMNERRDVYHIFGITVVAERMSKAHKVTQYIVSGSEVLKTTPWAGRYIPIIPVYGWVVWLKGKRYLFSLTRNAQDTQKMINYHRSAVTEAIGNAPKSTFIGPEEAFESAPEKWANLNRENYSFLPYKGAVSPQLIPFAGVPVGHLQEASSSLEDLRSIIGLYAPSFGEPSNLVSGAALDKAQAKGATSTNHFNRHLAAGVLHTGVVIADLMPRVLTHGQVLRYTGRDGSGTKQQAVGGQIMGKDGQPIMKEDGTAKVFDLSVGRYDVRFVTEPSDTSKKEKTANKLLEFVHSFPPAANVMGDVIMENLDCAGAPELARRMKLILPPEIREPNRNPEMEAQLQQTQAQLDQIGTQLKVAMEDRSLALEKLKIEAFNAETNRLKVTASSMQPEQIQALIIQTLQQVATPIDLAPIDMMQQGPPPGPPAGAPQMPPPDAMPPMPPEMTNAQPDMQGMPV